MRSLSSDLAPSLEDGFPVAEDWVRQGTNRSLKALVKYHTHKAMWLVTRHQHRPSEHDGHIRAIDGALFLRSIVRSLADRGKNYTLSPIRWDALSSFPLTAFPKDAGDQTVPIDVADSCTKNTMKHGLGKAFTFFRRESGGSSSCPISREAVPHIVQGRNSSPPALTSPGTRHRCFTRDDKLWLFVSF